MKFSKENALSIFSVLTVINLFAFMIWSNSNLENQLKLSEMRADVNTEFANELLWLQLNDVQKLSSDSLVAQGRLEGMVNYYSQDEEHRIEIDNLWHEGYMRGLGQTDWEYDAVTETHYNKGYKDALDKAFPDGNLPQYVNYPPREVSEDAIKTPEFDNKLEGLKDNTEVVDQLNEKIKEITNQPQCCVLLLKAGVSAPAFFYVVTISHSPFIDLTAITAQDGL